jgi:hypothetical protein
MRTQKPKPKANRVGKPRVRSHKAKAKVPRVPDAETADKFGFFSSPTVEQLVAAQGVLPLKDPGELAGGWPPDEDVDMFLKVIRRGRI